MTARENTRPASGAEVNPDELPEGWAAATLGDIVSKLVDGSHNPPPKQAKGHPMLSARNIGDGSFLLNEGYRLISERDFKVEHARTQVTTGDVLLTIVGSIGRSLVVPEGTEAFALQRSVAVIRPVLVDPTFLTYNLRAPGSQSFFEENGAGTAQKGVYLRTLSAMPLPLAPLAEQQRIVAQIEELLENVNASRDRLAKVSKILRAFRQSVLAAACSGRLAEDWREKTKQESHAPANVIHPTAALEQLPPETALPDSWDLSTLGIIVRQIETGKNLRCEERPPGPGEKGIVKISAVTWGEFDEDESKTLLDTAPFRPDRRIKIGDLLISRANTIDLVGACVIVRLIHRDLMLSDKILRLCVAEDWKKWLLLCLRSSVGRFQIENLATGNQMSMRNISQDSLNRIVVPLPSPSERDKIVGRVETLFNLADKIEKRVEAATKRAEKLTQAILAKAFRGELVPTEAELARKEGRAYEPASVLLERIKAESEKAPAKAGPKRHAAKRGKK